MRETFAVGINTTLVGMGVVFSVLIILSFTTWLLNTLVDKMVASKEKPASAPKAAPVAAPVATSAPATQQGISPEIVAAIMTAVSVATGTSAANLKFTAIKRLSGNNLPWAASGSAEIMANRQRFTEGGNR